MSSPDRVACALPAGEVRGRRERWLRLDDAWLIENAAISNGCHLGRRPPALRWSDAAERELRDLVALEREYCSFAEWFVARRGREPSLEVTAERDAVAAVRALFDGPGPPGAPRAFST